MGRTWALGLAAAGLLLGAAGCSQSGSYRLSWVFKVNGAIESSAGGCGQHGVDSILANGTDGSDSVRIIAQCVPGQFTGSAPPGNWSFTLEMLDAQGLPIASPDTIQPAGTAAIVSGGATAQFSIQFVPPTDCADHIDNDGNGLVDNGVECDGGAPKVQDAGTSADGGQSDGSQTDGARRDGSPGDAARTDGARPEGGVGARDGGSRDGAALDARG